MKKSNLSFNDFIDKCSMRNNVLITQKNFESFMLEQIQIRSYIPLQEKNMIIRKLINMLELINFSSTDSADFATNQDIHYLFNIILAYTNLEFTYADINIKHYDIIMQSGIVNLILEECQSDYDRFMSMVNGAMSYKTLFNIETMMNSVDPNQLEEKTKAINEVLSNKEIMEKLEKLLAYNDPNMKVLQQELESFDLKQFKEAINSLQK